MLTSYLAPPAVVLGVGLVTLAVIGASLHRARLRACACGYALEGLPEPVCPECGAPHEETRRRFHRRRLLSAVIVWSVAAASAGLFGAIAAQATAPRLQTHRAHANYTYPGVRRHVCELELEWTASGPPGAVAVTALWVTYTNLGRRERVDLNPREESAVLSDLTGLFRRMGTPYDDPAGTFPAEVAAAAMTAARAPTARPSAELRSNSFGRGSSSNVLALPRLWTIAASVPPLWVLGLWWLARRGPAHEGRGGLEGQSACRAEQPSGVSVL